VNAANVEVPLYASVLAAALIAAAFVVSGLVGLRKRHRDAPVAQVYAGAALWGVVIGSLLVFGAMPLRTMLMEDAGADRETYAALGGLLGIVALIRSGLLVRLPLLGSAVKAYRRALARKSIEDAEKQLERLARKDA